MIISILQFPLKLFLLILLSLFIILTCKENSVNPSSEDLFYPIKVGNNWEYEIRTYDSTGTLNYDGLIDETFIYERLKDDQFVYQFYSPLNPRSPACCDYRYYFQNKTDGIHFLTSSDSLGYWVYDNLLYKYPCHENNFFTNGINNYDTTFVISLNDTINCNAGTFICIVYKSIYYDITDTTLSKIIGCSFTYVSKGIGKIKYESYSINSNNQLYKRIEYSLKSYILN